MTARIVSFVLYFALGFGVALVLLGHDRLDIIAGAIVLGITLWVGLR